MKICDDSGLYVCLTVLEYILGHCLLVNGTTMIMWLLCAGEDELMRVTLFHSRFAWLFWMGTDRDLVRCVGCCFLVVVLFWWLGCLVVVLCWFCCSSRSVSFLVAFTQKM